MSTFYIFESKGIAALNFYKLLNDSINIVNDSIILIYKAALSQNKVRQAEQPRTEPQGPDGTSGTARDKT